MPDADRPVQDPPGRSGGRGRGHPGRLPPARPEVPPGSRGRARGRRPDGGDQRRVGAHRRPGGAGGVRSSAVRPDRRHAASGGDRAAASAAQAGPGAGRRGRRVRVRPQRPGQARARRRRRQPEIVSRDWTCGRSSQGGGYDESMRAPEGHGAAGPPPGRPSGTRPQLRALRRLVARRDRAARPRVHRVARPDADRAQRIATRSTRSSGRPGRRKSAASEAPSDAGCSAGARASGGRSGRARAASASGRSVAASARIARSTTRPIGRALDEQREQDDPEGDLLEQVALREVGGQRQRHARRPPPRGGRPRTGRGASRRGRGSAEPGRGRAGATRRRAGRRRRRARPTRIATIAQRDRPDESTRRPGAIARPTSRKTTAVSRKATNSQTTSIASTPVADIVRPGRGSRGRSPPTPSR